MKEQHSWLYNYHSKMLQMVGKQIAAARHALEVLKAHGYRVGRLHYLTHEEYNSFTYNQSGFMIKNCKLWLSKIGSIKLVLHRQPVNIKQVTVIRQAGKWYAVVACETAKPVFRFIDPSKSVGIDVCITKFSHDSDNYVIENPLFFGKMLLPLKRAHRKVSRRQKGSNNREKARRMLARLYDRIHNRRKNFLHKLSTYYSQRYDIIFLERLRTLNMVRNHRLARHILDSGWRTFKDMLGYKAKMAVEVEPHNTSVDCSRCRNSVPKSLAVRIHRCDKCGLVLDRDYNTNLNILQKGLLSLYHLPVERREVTPVEIPRESLKQEAHFVRHG